MGGLTGESDKEQAWKRKWLSTFCLISLARNHDFCGEVGVGG